MNEVFDIVQQVGEGTYGSALLFSLFFDDFYLNTLAKYIKQKTRKLGKLLRLRKYEWTMRRRGYVVSTLTMRQLID